MTPGDKLRESLALAQARNRWQHDLLLAVRREYSQDVAGWRLVADKYRERLERCGIRRVRGSDD